MDRKIVIAGGSGFIGQYLADFFIAKGYDIVILSRAETSTANNGVRYVKWDGATLSGDWAKELDGATALINMAGRTVNCRYNDENKRQIMDSRVNSTRALGAAIATCKQPPQVWLNSSSATIYSDTRGDMPANDEYSTRIGDDFSMTVCKTWEKTLMEQVTPHTRKIALRIAITLGDGSALTPLKRLAQFGLGGTQGGGDQWFSWVHVSDLAASIDFLINKPTAEGAYNIAAPKPLTNRDFMRTLRRIVGMPIGLPMPKFLLEFGARFILHTQTELVLKSRKVVSRRLPEAGFNFQFTEVEAALKDILK